MSVEQKLLDVIVLLDKRITNLELALLAYNSLTYDLLPPEAQTDVNDMMEDFFNNSKSVGGFDTTKMQGEP